MSVEYFQVSKFSAQKFSSLNFQIINMITVSCSFAHGFKIMRIPQPIIPFLAPQKLVTVLCSGSADVIEIPYIRCLDGRVPERYELWALAEDGVCKVGPYARVRLLFEFREDTFHTHFFNLRRF